MSIKVPGASRLFFSIFLLLGFFANEHCRAAEVGLSANYSVGESHPKIVLIESTTDGHLSNVLSNKGVPEVREHYGNPVYFIKYIISIPPVYV